MKNSPEDYDYLPPIVAATVHKGHFFAKITVGVISGLFFFFLLWASLSTVEEATHAQGKVIPSQYVQVVDNLEGGILKKILVKDGDIVQKDQIILRIDNVSAKSKFQENQENYYRLLATAERLKALTEERPFQPSQELLTKAPAIVQEEEEHFKVQQNKIQTELKIDLQGIEQKKQELLDQQAQLRKLQAEHAIIQEQLALKEPLAREHLVSKMDILNLRRDLAEQTGQIESLKITVMRATATLNQAKEIYEQTRIKYHDEGLSELREVEQKLEATKSDLTTEKDRVFRTDVRSPVHGIVKEVKIKTVGGVIRPGEDLVEIVPIEDKLLVEAQVLPADVAFLHPGMEAHFKVTAYDYSIYGELTGKVETVSADSTVDKKEQSFFKILLRTDKNYLEHKGKKMRIFPGMQVSVDIITGRKTILSYLLKPFIKARYNALTER